ncbi:DUF4012 domain-containing protein [Candidatus Gracilibacteria bacterium]|nr:DUF4012 domain-containing protein [Candidatus Gracilibacteria bacterium]
MKHWKESLFRFFRKQKPQIGWDFFHQKRKRRIDRWKKIGKITGIVLLVYLGIVLWPLHILLGQGILTGRTLIIFTNEAESRPCGGFVTAYGVFQLFPPHIEFHNSYALAEHTFGEAEAPLNKVSSTKNFWDLGTSLDIEECAETFRSAYREATQDPIDQVVLLNLGTVEDILTPFGKVRFNDKVISSNNLFSEFSRIVSDVDRHDETSLKTRKTPLSSLAKKLIFKSIINPIIAPRLTRILADNIQEGNVFISGISPRTRPERSDFALVEWNLGGAKSSRFLQKSIHIFTREETPKHWTFTVRLDVVHAGGIDEPLSQGWKGAFELMLPKFLGGEPVFWETEISPGESVSKQFLFEYAGDLKEFSLFRARNQSLSAEVIISLFPQQTFALATFDTHENVGEFFETMKSTHKVFRWMSIPDTSPPFITLHEVVDDSFFPAKYRWKWTSIANKSNKKLLLVEVHFNEKIKLGENFHASLIDRDFADMSLNEDPVYEDVSSLEDERTLILGFWQTRKQIDERFFLELKGVADFYGNPLSSGKRTIITR